MMTAAMLSVGPSLLDRLSAAGDGHRSYSENTPGRRYYMQGVDHLQAHDIMRKALHSAQPNQLLVDIERQLIEAHIGGMPVIEAGRLVGVVSRSDVARMQVLTGTLDGLVADELYAEAQVDGFQHGPQSDFIGFREKFARLRVRDAMRTQVVTCRPDTSVTDLAAAMLRHHIHRLIVVEGEKPVGIISSLDIVELVAKSAG